MRTIPRYRCHKEVEALKIGAVVFSATGKGGFILPEGEYKPIPVSERYLMNHDPQVNGYYIKYADGYESYSPAKAFEEGYTLIK